MFIPFQTRVYLALGSTDMRKAINGLSILVENSLEMDRRRNIIKILYWDRNGFCLWHKRLEKHRFKWPDLAEEIMEVDHRELGWLLEGLDLCQARAHEPLNYATLV